MVHKKYIKRGDKVFGPYIYKNYREGGKTKTKYLGKEKNLRVNTDLLVVLSFISLIFLSSIFIFYFNATGKATITGKASLDIKEEYLGEELLKGKLNLNLLQGELIPKDSKIIISLGEESKEFFLYEIIDSKDIGLINNSFYIENIGFFGEGEGYGLIGERKIYPDVNFKLNIFNYVGEESYEDGKSKKINETKPENINEGEVINETIE